MLLRRPVETRPASLFDGRLVLLLTFLVLAPAMRLWHAEPARQPQTLRPEQCLTVRVQPDAVYIEDTQVAEADLSRVLGQVRGSYPDAAVIVRGDRRIPYHRVLHVLQLVNQAGFLRAGIAPAEEQRPPSAG